MQHADTKHIIMLKDIEQTYQTGDTKLTALHKTTFGISQGGFTIIYGPSGSGKSTLLNILSGLQAPTTGTITYQGADIYSLRNEELAHFRASQIGIVYQSNYWVKSLTAVENVSMPLYFVGYTKARATKRALEALEQVGMAKYANRLPIVLSGGEQQRIAMARALVHNPPVIIADEPTGSLDSTSGAKIMDILSDCHDKNNQTIILVTHNMEYLPLADRLVHIEDGNVRVLDDHSIRETTAQLMKEMQTRISNMTRNKHGSEK